MPSDTLQYYWVAGQDLASASLYLSTMPTRATPERRKEWAELEINQPKPGYQVLKHTDGGEEWLTPVSPRQNTPFEHLVAVLVLFSWFGAMWAMPWTTLAIVYFTAKGNAVAWTIVAIMTGLSLLPAGKVGCDWSELGIPKA